MATDTFGAVVRISQMKSTNIVVDLASIAYFALMAVGFITMPFSLLRRTRKEASEV
jgi:hypothetical protein